MNCRVSKLAVLMGGILASSLAAQNGYRVDVNVTSDTDGEANQLTSYVRNELRKLNDTIVTSEGTHLSLSVVLVHVPPPIDLYAASVAALIDDHSDKFSLMINQWAFTGSQLDNLAKRIVAACDVNILEAMRQSPKAEPDQPAVKVTPSSTKHL